MVMYRKSRGVTGRYKKTDTTRNLYSNNGDTSGINDVHVASPRTPVWRYLVSLVKGLSLYLGGLLFALCVALAVIIIVDTAFDVVLAALENIIYAIKGEPRPGSRSVRSELYYHLENVIRLATFCLATMSFAVVSLKIFPIKNVVHSVVWLEIIGVVAVMLIAGSGRNTTSYEDLCIGLGVLLATVLLAMRFPHSVFLSSERGY